MTTTDPIYPTDVNDAGFADECPAGGEHIVDDETMYVRPASGDPANAVPVPACVRCHTYGAVLMGPYA